MFTKRRRFFLNISISKREGILWNLRQDLRQKWSEGILNGLNSEFLSGPTREFSIRNLDELIVIALHETLTLEFTVESESEAREFLLSFQNIDRKCSILFKM